MRVLHIGTTEPASLAFLAPMSGITDAPFRRIAARFGAGLVVSEMIASAELAHEHPESILRAEGQGLSPHVVQIAGREARWMAEGARRAVAAGADIVDINMGCPARKVTSGLSGSALMRDLDHASALIEAVVGAVHIPVTLKMRLGWDRSTLNAPKLARRAQDIGVAMVTVHGRTRCDFYNGSADWGAVRAVRDAVSIPLVVNGDIRNAMDARRAMELSGADAVMIGRAACGRPWLVGEVGRTLSDHAIEPLTLPERLDVVIEHYQGLLLHYGRETGIRVARKHLGWYLREALAPPDADAWHSRLMRETSESRVIRLLRAACDAGPALRVA